MAVRLSDLVKGKGPLSPRQVKRVREWVADDWEMLDHDRNLVALIERLLATIRPKDK